MMAKDVREKQHGESSLQDLAGGRINDRKMQRLQAERAREQLSVADQELEQARYQSAVLHDLVVAQQETNRLLSVLIERTSRPV